VYVRRVIAGVSGSAGSLAALRYAAAMARTEGAELTPVLAWMPPGGDLADRRFPCHELRVAWRKEAQDRLWSAISLAVGGPPEDVEFSPKIVRGEPGEVLSRISAEPGDVLVIGAGRRGPGRLFGSSVSRYCLAHARCPVIAVPPSDLAAHVHGVHGWRLLHRAQPDDADLHAADV
jgi:nucleotide-binding universal stress UspA family protein